jgi:hypothetical protein
LATKGVEESKDQRVRRVDILGATFCALALAGITYGLIEGPVSKWSTKSIISLALGFILSAVFLWYERRKKDPMVHLSLFQSRNFTGSNAMTFAMYGALAGFMFALVIYMQTKLGYSAIKAGASLLPVSIILLLFSRRVGGLSSKYGPRWFMTAGPLIASAGILLLINYQTGDSYWWFLLPRVLLFSIGLVLLVAPLTTTVMTSVEDSSSGIASGINNAVSRVAGLVVIALLGLFGAGHVFRFSMILCGLLALAAGLISYITIQNNPKPLKVTN